MVLVVICAAMVWLSLWFKDGFPLDVDHPISNGPQVVSIIVSQDIKNKYDSSFRIL
jgi:hypothetical protein